MFMLKKFVVFLKSRLLLASGENNPHSIYLVCVHLKQFHLLCYKSSPSLRAPQHPFSEEDVPRCCIKAYIHGAARPPSLSLSLSLSGSARWSLSHYVRARYVYVHARVCIYGKTIDFLQRW
jgi:hypothetical protein